MHQKLLITVIILIATISLKSQNLVPNPSFEKLRDLPIKRLEVYNYEFESKSSNKAFKEHLNYWFSGNNNSPDLRILSNEYFGKSKSKYGEYYRPRTGENVIGIVTYMENKEGNNFREYIEVKLKKRLRENIKTYVELWVLLDRQSKLASNNIGCYFSMKKIHAIGAEPIKLMPQINEDSIIRGNRFEWKKISGSFIPKEGFNFLTIGNFFSKDETDLEEILRFRGEPFIDPTAYYLIDDVRVWQEGDKIPEKKITTALLKSGNSIILENVEFDSNSSNLKAESYNELNELLGILNTNKLMKIEIRGHTDNIGTEQSNMDLSRRRAQSVCNYILNGGIKKERLSFKGYGESSPIRNNETEEDRKRNRRVEFIILSME